MIQKLLKLLDKIWPAQVVYAHCDIPCGIYTIERAKTAAKTVAKMVEKLLALPAPENTFDQEKMLAYHTAVARFTKQKEDAAQECKSELLILWTDYFKSEHLEKFPNLHETFWKAAKLCSKNKQNVSKEAAEELQGAVEEIETIFQKAEAIKK